MRLARAFTGRERVLCSGYHGWHDWYVGTTSRHRGVPGATRDLSATFAYNDIYAVLDELDDSVACVILEPTIFEEPRAGFLAELRRACHGTGALLVFDEMWTGFRLALGGAQEFFDVTADLACFSKAVANGMPLSVLTGRKDVMSLLEKEVFFFTTFGGEALSLAAARATIDELARQSSARSPRRAGPEAQGRLQPAGGEARRELHPSGRSCVPLAHRVRRGRGRPARAKVIRPAGAAPSRSALVRLPQPLFFAYRRRRRARARRLRASAAGAGLGGSSGRSSLPVARRSVEPVFGRLAEKAR